MRGSAFALALLLGACSSMGVLGLRYAPLGLAAEFPASLERSAADAIPAAPSNADPTVVTEATPDVPPTVTDLDPGAAGPSPGTLAARGMAETPVQLTAKASALFDAMNAARADAGESPLAWSPELEAVALVRAAHLARHSYFDHYGPDGTSAFSELATRGISYQLAGENLARNNYPDSHTVTTAFEALMASPGHRANILESRFSRAAVAAVRNGGMWLYVTVFMD
ncbi:MAG: CAP domain-containing protein [Dehalococcoidia bacterium]|nr:CAP domain-containing protein [Dehalococcoidia bacterium]